MSDISNNNIKTFEAKTLDEVYEQASEFFKCSANDLDIDIIQAPSKGFLGFFAKTAIIKATSKQVVSKNNTHKKQHNKSVETTNDSTQTLSSKLSELNKQTKSKQKVTNIKKEKIFNDFYEAEAEQLHQNPIVEISNKTDLTIADEISNKVNELMGNLCYDIDEVKVTLQEDNIVLVEFSGADCALLIGKEGYRYKALSYILFNWISDKYSLTLRLEIAEFLVNQEKAIETYLEPVIKAIKKEGFFKTKILDGILIHIALNKLRDEFPDKYVAIKTTRQGDKYILVNEYRK